MWSLFHRFPCDFQKLGVPTIWIFVFRNWVLRFSMSIHIYILYIHTSTYYYIYIYIYTLDYISIYMHQALPPPPSPPHMGWVPYTGPIWDLPPPPLWCGGGVALSPSPPCGVVDGSHILVPYEIFPLPPLWCGGGVALSSSPPCGVVDGSHILVIVSSFPLWLPEAWSWLPTKVGMVCMACMLAIVCMLLYVW